MADLILFQQSRPTDWAGDFVPGALATFYASGTTTPLTVYRDQAGLIPHSQPIEADGEGVFPAVFAFSAAKAVITDPDGVELPGSPIDPCVKSATSASGASQIGFEPTAEIPEGNVQDAIERVQANLTDTLADAGVAVTQAPLLSNLNATSIPSGRYRFNSTTTGTFPSGVVAADEGTVVISSGAVGNQVMELIPKAGLNKYQRNMVSLVWGAWQEIPVFTAGAARGALAVRGVSNWISIAGGSDRTALIMNGVDPAWTSLGYTWQEVDTSSGTTTIVTGLTGAREIVCQFIGTSLSGTDDIWVQIGTASAVEGSGYTQQSSMVGVGGSTSANAFAVYVAQAASAVYGQMLIHHYGSNRWVSSHATSNSTTRGSMGGGEKTLAGALTRIRIMPSGSDTFDGGVVLVGWR